MGVASYSILLGIYSSVIVTSNNIELGRSIRKFALEEEKLLESIGSHKYFEEEVGFASLTKEEAAKQVEAVIEEFEEVKSSDERREEVHS